MKADLPSIDENRGGSLGDRIAGVRELFEETGLLLACPSQSESVSHISSEAPYASCKVHAELANSDALRKAVHDNALEFYTVISLLFFLKTTSPLKCIIRSINVLVHQLCGTTKIKPDIGALLPWARWFVLHRTGRPFLSEVIYTSS